jgi:SAM-dependent methyltransferase
MFFSSLKQRDRQPEIMDQPGLNPADHRAALRGLARINFVSGSARILWPELQHEAHLQQTGPFTVLDVATGAGDMPIRLWARARRAGVSMRIAGCDISATAIAIARDAAARTGTEVEFFAADALKEGLPDHFDAITCSLFLHHLDEADAVEFLRRIAAAARKLVLVNDLSRSRFGLILAAVGSRLLTRSEVVHVDGPRSVRAAFTPSEALALANRAGLIGAKVVRRWPCRYLLSWRRP